jgi:D-alanyl-D-alanine dipeptidase
MRRSLPISLIPHRPAGRPARLVKLLTFALGLVGPTSTAHAQNAAPPAEPAAWRGLIGEYGAGAIVLERDGRLVLRLDSVTERRLTPVGRDRFAALALGVPGHIQVRFARGTSGRAAALLLGDSVMLRRSLGAEDGAVFRITPLRPIDELRREADQAAPPASIATGKRPSDLVELTSLDSTLELDIRYATDRNFLGTPVYREARAFLQRPAAEALVRVHRQLEPMGLGLLIHDAYRPWSITKVFWDATPPAQREFVANPAQGSRHNRGAAVDLTLFDLASGRAVEMPGGYDEFSRRSYPDYPGGTSMQRWHRDLLRRLMEAQGFTVFEVEWWHFDWRDWREYPIGNEPFERLGGGGGEW